jgi:hypothetical protein
MALVSFGLKVDMNQIPSASTEDGLTVAYDLDGILKQKDYLGNITPIGGSGLRMPMPKISLSSEPSTVQSYNTIVVGNTYSSFTLYSPPVLTAMDITHDQIDSGIWIEMLLYRKKRKGRNGYVVPTSWVDGKNTLTEDILQMYPNSTFTTRGGDLDIGLKDRPNHIKINYKNQKINLGDYFHNRFEWSTVQYRDTGGNFVSLDNCLIPVSRSRSSYFGKTIGYSPDYTPTYAVFRYVMWQPQENGKGQFVTGPISQTIKITALNHPFLKDDLASVTYNKACCSINPLYNKLYMKCFIETKL